MMACRLQSLITINLLTVGCGVDCVLFLCQQLLTGQLLRSPISNPLDNQEQLFGCELAKVTLLTGLNLD